MNNQAFAARLQALDESHLRFLDELAKADRRLAQSSRQCTTELAESRRQFNEQLAESRQQFDDKLAEQDRKWAESDRRFTERLHLYDQRDVALRRMERLGEHVDLLSRRTGQIADDLVEHKRDPDAHA